MTAKYRTVIIDCPWNEVGGGKIKRGADRHYKVQKTIDLPDIITTGCEHWKDVSSRAHCYFYTTNNFLPDALWVLNEIGFRYVTNLVWVKTRIGLGQYFRGQHELILFGVRGETQWLEGTWPTVLGGGPIPHVMENGKRVHSAKPPQLHEMIEAAEPGPYLELFARTPREGWTVWGNEIE